MRTTLMQAISYSPGPSGDVLKLEEIDKPLPADDEVLIKVRAAAVNPLDYHFLKHAFLRRVMAGLTKVKILRPGRDVAGQVEAIGRNVTQFKAGDEVFGGCNGAFAEYVCARESKLAIKPSKVSFEEAASTPVAGLTALQGLRDKAQLQPGQKSVSLLAKLDPKDLDLLGALIAEGKVKPVIDRRYRLSEVPNAVSYLEEGHARGKVIIEID